MNEQRNGCLADFIFLLKVAAVIVAVCTAFVLIYERFQ